MTCRSVVLAGTVFFAPSLFAQKASSPAASPLKSTPKTVAWRYHAAKTLPALHLS